EGGPVDCDASRRAVGNVIASVSRNAAALICLANLRQHDDYTYTHCVDVAALAVVYGRYLGIAGEDLVDLGLAGLFHDLGKTRVDRAIIVKPGRLSEAEFAAMKRHPALGRSILEHHAEVPPAVLRAVAEHHERFNGQGYPAGLRHDQISLFGRILALADVFDALTSDRSYRGAMPADKALSLMFGMRDKHFASPDLQRFVKCLGIYPVGSLVRLSDGRLAVVCRHRPHRLLAPVVNVVTDDRGEDQDPVRLDLADPPGPGQAPLSIVEGLSPRDVGVNVARWLR
ncbi:MAG: HD-GYP domain-containing protein, partial [Desulfovibrionaceae bacterium]